MKKHYCLHIGFGWFIEVPRHLYNWATENTRLTGMVVMSRG